MTNTTKTRGAVVVVAGGVVGTYVGTDAAGVEWVCYDLECYEAMCGAFDAAQARREVKVEAKLAKVTAKYLPIKSLAGVAAAVAVQLAYAGVLLAWLATR